MRDPNLHDRPRVLGADQEVGAVAGEVQVIRSSERDPDRSLQVPGGRVVEVQGVLPLRDIDRVSAVRREVQVVGVGNADRADGAGGPRIDHGERVAVDVPDVEVLHVPGGRDVLGLRADVERSNHPERSRVDDAHVVRGVVRNVDPGGDSSHRGSEGRGLRDGGVDVPRPRGRRTRRSPPATNHPPLPHPR